MSEPKKKSVALVLCIFAGGFGAHRFYVGKNGTAIVQALLVVTGWIASAAATDGGGASIAAVILMGAGVWVIVDLIRIATGSFLGDSAVDTSTSQPGVSAPARLQQRLLLSAKHAGGAIMPTTVAMSSGIEINDAKRILETMVDEGHAELRARKDGTLVYVPTRSAPNSNPYRAAGAAGQNPGVTEHQVGSANAVCAAAAGE